MGEHGTDEATTPYRVPIFSRTDGRISCRYNRSWQTRPDATALAPEYHRAFDVIDAIASEIKLTFEFQPGDIQLVSNLTAFHGRDAHATVAKPEDTRWLMRAWMFIPGFRPLADEAVERHGLIRHGNLGLTAKELAAALSQAPAGFDAGPASTLTFPQPRRADGAPIRCLSGNSSDQPFEEGGEGGLQNKLQKL
jgi:hypothetical protein